MKNKTPLKSCGETLDGIDSNPYCSLSTEKFIIHKSVFRLNDCFEDVACYANLFRALEKATENDLIIIHLNNYGGCVHIAISIINAIKRSVGRVVTINDHMCYSAASMVLLAGHHVFCQDYGRLMIHNYSGYSIGKAHEIYQAVEFDKRNYKATFKDIYKDFLSKEEMKAVLGGDDIYLDADDTNARLSGMGKLLTDCNAEWTDWI